MTTDPFDYQLGFKSEAERLKDERRERADLASKILPYGITYLDDCLRGIWPKDLVLIGADTGVGKTELITLIALTVASKGKRVHVFALEAEEGELGRRIKYKNLCAIAREHNDANLAALNYTDWLCNRLVEFDDKYGHQAQRRTEDQTRALMTFYRGSKFTGAQYERTVQAVQDETSLTVLDHLHYVDLDDDNENRGMKQLTKTIRDTSLEMGKPVICVAHLRKRDYKRLGLVPDEQEFHGASDISKIATRCVLMKRAPYNPSVNRHKPLTYMHIPKDRPSGATGLIAALPYDIRSRKYGDTYALGRQVMHKGKAEFELLAHDEIPRWAKHAKVPVPTYERGTM